MADPVTISPAPGFWVVRAAGAVLGETRAALELREDGHAPVIYFPRDAVAMAFLERTAHTAFSPPKGTATHYAIHAESGVIDNAAWSYEDPVEAVREISGYLAFDPEKVTVERA